MKLNTHIKLSTTLAMLCVLFIISCGSQKSITTKDTFIEKNPKIIFLNYSIKKTGYDNKTVTFLNQTIAQGKLKKKPTEQGNTGDLICSQLDKNSNTIEDFIIKNPFVKTIEFTDESNNFQKKQIEVDSTNFSLRLQLLPETKYISISNYNSNKPLIKTPIY